jgi:hypothetical protein
VSLPVRLAVAGERNRLGIDRILADTALRDVDQVRLSLRPSTVKHIEQHLRVFGAWAADIILRWPAGSTAATTTAPAAGGDAKLAQLAASLEVLAVGTYKAVLDAAGSESSSCVATFVQTAMTQHQMQLDK